MDLLTELLDVTDAECHCRLQRAGERRIKGPSRAGGECRILPPIRDDDVSWIAGIAEGVEGERKHKTRVGRFVRYSEERLCADYGLLRLTCRTGIQ